MSGALPIPVLETERLRLTIPTPQIADAMVRFVRENREHLAPWEPVRGDDYYTVAYWEQSFAKAVEEFQQDSALRLVLLARDGDGATILGHCNFRNIVRGVFQACHLGYALDYRAEGKGIMGEALSAAISYVFEEMRLHRIMAAYIPSNARSGALLKRLGFSIEGVARDYLTIAGAWQDHILTARTNPAWQAPER